MTAPVAAQGYKLLLGLLQQGNCKAQGCLPALAASLLVSLALQEQQARQKEGEAPSRWSGRVKAEARREALRAVSRSVHVNMVLVQASEQ